MLLALGLVWHYHAEDQTSQLLVLIPSAVFFLHGHIIWEGNVKENKPSASCPLNVELLDALSDATSIFFVVVLGAKDILWQYQRSGDKDGSCHRSCLLSDCDSEAAPWRKPHILFQCRKAVHDQTEESLGEKRVERRLE